VEKDSAEAMEDIRNEYGWLGEAAILGLRMIYPERTRAIANIPAHSNEIQVAVVNEDGRLSDFFPVSDVGSRAPGLKFMALYKDGHYWHVSFGDGKLNKEQLELERALAISLGPQHSAAEGQGQGQGDKPGDGEMKYGVEVFQSFQISSTWINVAMGSVAYFKGDAIVNAANESCQGGGGVDGAVTDRGGEALAAARKSLPTIGKGTRAGTSRRCKTGSAVTTISGDLPCTKHVIHAVGPDYRQLHGRARGGKLLKSAYEASVNEAAEKGVQSLAFSLLSAGIYSGGSAFLEGVVKVGVEAVAGEVQALVGQAPREVYFVAFTAAEKEALLKACNEHFGDSGAIEISDDDDDDGGDGGAKLSDGGDDDDDASTEEDKLRLIEEAGKPILPEQESDTRLGVLLGRMGEALPKALLELQTKSCKIGHWAWYAWPTEKEGSSKPSPKTAITAAAVPDLLKRAPEVWKDVLELVCELIDENGGSLRLVIPKTDRGRIYHFVKLFEAAEGLPRACRAGSHTASFHASKQPYLRLASLLVASCRAISQALRLGERDKAAGTTQ
jgi:O-acetyl-ADP-ribose deacetylase (regulator of RNase III)